MPKERIDVFISSTSIDLPEHRAAVRDAIISLGLHPSGMETWPVSGDNPVDLCRKRVFDAEIYLGIYAHRYGWRPDGYDGKSITELEYEWAGEVQRDGKPIPRLCFIMADSHSWPKAKMELEAETELTAFKKKVKENQVGFFTTPDDLKAQVTAALAPYAARSGGRVLVPYLRWLHEQSKKSGLLHVLNPRDASSNARPITVEQVYTPLDTQQLVTRDENGRMLHSHEILQLKQGDRGDDDFQQSRLTAMEAANLFERLVLLGDPGGGKSTFVSFLALCLSGQMLDPEAGWLERLTEQGWEQDQKLPIFVTLRDFAQDVPPDARQGTAALLFDHIRNQLAKWKLESAFPALESALDEGRALVLFDGLDEVPPERRELVRDSVTDFMARCDRGNRYIVTCRVLSYANPAWKLEGMVDETIAPFDADKIAHFIQTWYTALEAMNGIDSDTARQRVADLTEGLNHPHLQNIAANPMLLTVMAVVHNHTGALPRESARLYEQCVELLMLRWRPAEALSLMETLNIRADDLYRMLWEIAYDAHSKQAEQEGAADISEADIVAIAAAHLNDDLGKARLFCNYVESHAGLLVGRGAPGRWRMFTFPHRTFQEYLAGCYAANNTFWEIAPELARRDTGWREVLMLATGHLVFNQGRIDLPLLAINEIVPPDEPPADEADWRAVCRAGDMLVLIGAPQPATAKKGPRILVRMRERLAELVCNGYLTPVERAAAGRALGILGDSRKGVGIDAQTGLPDIEWVDIPDDGEWVYQAAKHPPLPAYRISRYPITYAQFQAFVDASDFDDDGWWKGIPPEQEAYERNYRTRAISEQAFQYANHPREVVSWYQAVAFCAWLSDKVGYEVRLPTEAEWEKAARGTDERVYPYGNTFDAHKGNTYETGIGQTSAVGLFPHGASPYGVLDMSGNVWEWCLNKYDAPEQIEVDDSGDDRVARGGSWYFDLDFARAAFRYYYHPVFRYDYLGFRVVCRPPSPGL